MNVCNIKGNEILLGFLMKYPLLLVSARFEKGFFSIFISIMIPSCFLTSHTTWFGRVVAPEVPTIKSNSVFWQLQLPFPDFIGFLHKHAVCCHLLRMIFFRPDCPISFRPTERRNVAFRRDTGSCQDCYRFRAFCKIL